jgi:hypothetical protein
MYKRMNHLATFTKWTRNVCWRYRNCTSIAIKWMPNAIFPFCTFYYPYGSIFSLTKRLRAFS